MQLASRTKPRGTSGRPWPLIPSRRRLTSALANVLEMLGKLSAHAEEFEKGLARWQDNYDAVVLLSGCRLYQNDREGGIAALRQAIAIDPRRPRAWSNLGGALRREADLTEATEVLQHGYELELAAGGHGDCALNLATVLREQGRWTEALHLLERSLAQVSRTEPPLALFEHPP